ncbi:coiled-coil domain-containing protein [Leclercia adecarboxylata]|uniref:hypothetical protein n=1 Tax=Leclercia adecarboxylata TaxID=83655 RepID=UPI0021D2162B|nr:hypothetical protein [Leclercia adecarboxylata]MCU6673727.1 hypothetical protein [Leclercia adecarboxylata]MCV3303801.1 hypothetical protein [Leclercia adecarboxylata]MCV3307809.1 hypothetical protein [Leclercia adecarboxylata]
MRRKITKTSKTQPHRTATVNKSNLQVMVDQEDNLLTIIPDNISALQVQLEITQSKAFNLMAEKRQLQEMLKQRDADAAIKIRELAKMGELIIGIDNEKNELNQKTIALNTQLEQTRKTLANIEKKNKDLEAKNKQIQESLATRFDELANLAKLLEISERTLMAREAELEGVKKSLEKFKNTLTWKAAKPARIISARLSKTKKSGSKEQHIALIIESGLFNTEWYQKICPELSKLPLTPIEHYLSIGYKMGLNPSEKFNGNLYLERYPDVAQEGVNPLIHYILFGKNEGRTI